MEVDDETSTHSDAEVMEVDGYNDDSNDASVYSSALDVEILTTAAPGGALTTTDAPAAAAVAAGAMPAGAGVVAVAVAPGAAAAAGAAPTAPVQVDESEGTQVLEEQTEVFSSYKPTITIGQPHPSPVIESGLLSSVLLPPLAYDALALPPDAISQGKLSSLQLESILYAGQRHRLVQNGVRAGFFLGDSTGTGKGRQLAGMILDNIARGRRKHMWVSTSNDLKEEAIRDFADIGASGVLVKDMAELDAAAGALGMSKEFVNASSGLVIFTTYSTLIGHKRLGKKQLQGMANSSKGAKTDPSTKVARVDQLVDFFGGEAFDGIIAFDECHKARGSHVNPEQSSKASQAALELQRRLPLARIVYASATGVDSLEQMGFATRLLLWGGGSPSFKNFEAFTAKFLKKGGNLGLLELLAIELKLSGCYVARGLSWEGSEFDQEEAPLNPEQIKVHAQCCKFFRDLKEELADAMATAGSGGGGSEEGGDKRSKTHPMKLFWSLQQRFFRDLLNAFKVNTVVAETKKALLAGQCVVIGLQSTGETGLEHALERMATEPGAGKYNDRLISGAQEGLCRYLKDHFPTCRSYVAPQIKSLEEIDHLEKLYAEKSIPFDKTKELREREAKIAAAVTADKAPVPIPALVDSRDMLLEEARNLPMPPSPLDDLIDQLGGPACVAEMTGRKGRMIRHGDKFYYEHREKKGPGSAGGKSSNGDSAVESVNQGERKAFMTGNKLVAIISDAASTGISLHASIQHSKGNPRRRVHLTLELAFSADKTLQQLGRSHRSSQMSAPLYKLLITDMGGERRFASAVARKLLSLGALTRGDRRAATVADFSSFNLETHAGSKALKKALAHVEEMPPEESEQLLPFVRGVAPIPNVDMAKAVAIRNAVYEALADLGMYEKNMATVSRFLNRILVLEAGLQNSIFHLFEHHLHQVIKDQKTQGIYDTGAMELRATRVSVLGEPVTVYEDKSTGARCTSVTLQLDRGVSFDKALEFYEEALEEDEESKASFWSARREQYGHTNVLLALPKLTAPHLVYVTRPNTGRSPYEQDGDEIRHAYQRLKNPEDAREAWDTLYDKTEELCVHGPNCKVGADCSSGSRRQVVGMVTGAVVPVFNALESTITRFRVNLTKAESDLRVVRAQLTRDDDDDEEEPAPHAPAAEGTCLVGIRFPAKKEIVADLKKTIAELLALQAAGGGGAGGASSRIEPITPVDATMFKKATEAKRTIASYFSAAPSSKKPKTT